MATMIIWKGKTMPQPFYVKRSEPPVPWNGIWFVKYSFHSTDDDWEKIEIRLTTDEEIGKFKWHEEIVEWYGPISTTVFE